MTAFRASAPRLRKGRPSARFAGWSLWLALAFGICGIALADGLPQEYEVKAQCLYHFAKYVEWPSNEFSASNAPITICVIGDDHFAEMLKAVVAGKTIDGRPVAVQSIERRDESQKCQILFVSFAENKRLDRILGPVNSSPVLTVGEGTAFAQEGGIISFVIRNQKVRFDIDLDAAKQAGLKISSRLLSLADTVHEKPK
ncbi:MAG TPA: YfiR family protein [Verrucomicrobiae bacterium]|jgi:hypothetical protein